MQGSNTSIIIIILNCKKKIKLFCIVSPANTLALKINPRKRVHSMISNVNRYYYNDHFDYYMDQQTLAQWNHQGVNIGI